jgi:hypothetical protein
MTAIRPKSSGNWRPICIAGDLNGGFPHHHSATHAIPLSDSTSLMSSTTPLVRFSIFEVDTSHATAFGVVEGTAIRELGRLLLNRLLKCKLVANDHCFASARRSRTPWNGSNTSELSSKSTNRRSSS